MIVPGHYALMANLFEYPHPEYPDKAAEVYKFLSATYPSAARELNRFRELLPIQNVRTMRGLYTHTFDVQAITTLDIGYVLFGDDYKRGELLANLSREHREAGNDCGHELADHLPNVLRLMA
jgi:nitrate reductase assembly molybdenum cofactor insertion protein NarJ